MNIHEPNNTSDLDLSYWNKIVQLKNQLAKDSLDKKSLFTRIKNAIEKEDFQSVSDLQKEITTQMQKLKDLDLLYENNMID